MRRPNGGWLAAPLLLLATGCGIGDASATPPPTSLTPPPALVAERASNAEQSPDVVAAPDALRVLVVAVDGAETAGLDAAITTLLGRPGLDVVAVAPGIDAAGELATMSGFPVRALRGGIGDILDGTDGLDDRPHLVVVGITTADVVGASMLHSSAAGVVAEASAHGVPSLVVGGSGNDVDYAAAALQLGELFDFDLDRVLSDDVGWVLAVPSCTRGMVRERLDVDRSIVTTAGAVDCLATDPLPPSDDVEAHERGFATLSRVIPD